MNKYNQKPPANYNFLVILFIALFCLGGWGLWLEILLNATRSNFAILLYFNHYGEAIPEIILCITVITLTIIGFYYILTHNQKRASK